ncbi:MAG: hypothetical protein WC292_00405 [Clostridia bacterium]
MAFAFIVIAPSTATSGVQLVQEVTGLQVELGSTATAFEPFTPDSPSPNYPSLVNSAGKKLLVNSNEVIIPTLHKIGDVADEWNSKTGEITRRIGVKVFDGTEATTLYTYNDLNGVYFASILPENQLRGPGFCTHESRVGNYGSSSGTYMWVGANNRDVFWIGICDYLNKPTVGEIQDWLADQYNNGTPVTLYYQLSTPVIEQVATKVPSYPKITEIVQDNNIKTDITATAKIVDLGE